MLDSGAARGDDAMASMTNLRRMYIRRSKSIITLRAVLRLKLAKNACPGDLCAMNTRARERVNRTLLRVLVTLDRIKYSLYIGTTNLAITVPFTLNVKLPVSRADRLFFIAFEAQ